MILIKRVFTYRFDLLSGKTRAGRKTGSPGVSGQNIDSLAPRIFTMKTVLSAFVLIVHVVCWQAAFAQDRGGGNKAARGRTTEEVLYRKSYALLIGNSAYIEWNSLPGVERDIPGVEAVLRDKHGFIVEKALNLSKKELLDRIDQFVSKYGQDYDNRLVIYYAGHGYTTVLPDGRVMGYLVMKDAPLVPPVEESLVKTPKNIGEFRLRAISMGEIENYAREIATRHAIFIFDSCFSGTILYRDTIVNVPKEVSPEELEQMRGFLTAGNEKQRVRDDSPFRRALIKGLEGKADTNDDGYILSSELGAYVKREVYLETRDTPMPQSPIFAKRENFSRGDMIFIRPTGSSKSGHLSSEKVGAVNVTVNHSANAGIPGGPQFSPELSTPGKPFVSTRGKKANKVLFSFGVLSGRAIPASDVNAIHYEFSGLAIDSLKEKGLTVLNRNEGALSESEEEWYLGAKNSTTFDEKSMRFLPVALIVDVTIKSMEDLPQFQGLFVSMVNGRIEIIDTDNNKTILSEKIDQVRGFGNTREQARKNALKSAAEGISDSFLNLVKEKAR